MHGRHLAEAEVRAREEMSRGLAADRDSLQQRLDAAVSGLKEQEGIVESLRKQVCPLSQCMNSH